MRASSGLRVALPFVVAVVAGSDVSAHRRDELLQAARIGVEPHHVDLALDLTPGIAIAEAFIAAIDRDRDGVLSAEEQHAYASRVLTEMQLDLDGQLLDVQRVASTFPALDAFRRGEGTIQVQAVAALPRVADGEHHLSFRNMHRRDVSVYLANALVPESDRIAITAQRRDAEQRDLTIDYAMRRAAMSARAWVFTLLAGAAVMVLLIPRRVGKLRFIS